MIARVKHIIIYKYFYYQLVHFNDFDYVVYNYKTNLTWNINLQNCCRLKC
jgi:hypothetical protein